MKMNKSNWWGLKPLSVHLIRLLWLPFVLFIVLSILATLISVFGLGGFVVGLCFCILCGGSYYLAQDVLDEYL